MRLLLPTLLGVEKAADDKWYGTEIRGTLNSDFTVTWQFKWLGGPSVNAGYININKHQARRQSNRNPNKLEK